MAECPSRRATEGLVWNYCSKKFKQSQDNEKCIFLVNRNRRGQNRKLELLLFKKYINNPHKGAYLSLPLKHFVTIL